MYDLLRESELSRTVISKSTMSKPTVVKAAAKAGTPVYALQDWDEVALDDDAKRLAKAAAAAADVNKLNAKLDEREGTLQLPTKRNGIGGDDAQLFSNEFAFTARISFNSHAHELVSLHLAAGKGSEVDAAASPHLGEIKLAPWKKLDEDASLFYPCACEPRCAESKIYKRKLA
eukprot:17192-Prymnesium_polylepis.1